MLVLPLKYDICEAFVVWCTLPVNTGACLSRRRVGTGVFTDQACATYRKRSRSLLVEEPAYEEGTQP
ncbi:hypothetical protein DXB77_07110 [Clostridium sp. OM05-9]|nr:hypothetical protein DWW39_07530 [Clostridium sp. AF15-31]RHP90554.1 hypothetical protein DXA07_11420 [Clostridium sp. AM54-37XD]RHP94331.1 hypothetical protein DXA00_11480 [Clostridium sp. AM54-14XD]RHV12138.1 hypothetical protein DXB77_07110 [Clostridium sp. OM05-9]RHV78337.1 hypothetical protein DXB01_09335 [Clostridium sp. OF10-22XD]